MLPASFKSELKSLVLQSPINNITGKHVLLFATASAHLLSLVSNMVCSMKYAGIKKNEYVVVCYDQSTFEHLRSLNISVLLLGNSLVNQPELSTDSAEYKALLKFKPTILYQLLLWDVEVIVSDVDVVYLDRFESVFDGVSDFEFQFDEKRYASVNRMEVAKWRINTGFYKTNPSENSRTLMKLWLNHSYNTPNMHDQECFQDYFSRFPSEWITDDTFKVKVGYLSMRIHILHPVLITNYGAVWNNGKLAQRAYAQANGITHPYFIHFIHLKGNEWKENRMKHRNLWFLDDKLTCLAAAPEGVKFTIWSG